RPMSYTTSSTLFPYTTLFRSEREYAYVKRCVWLSGRSAKMTVSLNTSTQAGTYSATPERGEWVTQAKCRNGDPDALFVCGAEQRKAAVNCRHCPVVNECRSDALD